MNAIVPKAQQQQAARVIDLNGGQLALIKRTLAADCNDDEFNLFIEVARRMNADPFRRHLYALVYNKDDKKKRKMSIITGIDFYRTTAARNRDYRPDDQAPTFVYKEELKSTSNPLGIESCSVRSYKLTADGQWYPVVGEVYWAEYVPLEEMCDAGWEWVETGERWEDSNKPKKKRMALGEVYWVPKGKWKDMARVMIAKCAEAVGLRKGWPEDLSGVYVEEELARATAEDNTASEMAERSAEELRLKRVGAANAIMILWEPGGALEAVPLGSFVDRTMAWLREVKSADEVRGWRDTNRAPLQEFWARQKSDGLAISKACEDRIAEFKAAPKVIEEVAQ